MADNKIDLLAILAKHIDYASYIPKKVHPQLLAGLSEVWNTAVDEFKKLQRLKYLAGETGYLTKEDIEQVKQMIK